MAERVRLDSPDNPKIKEAARLRDRRGRKKAGRFLVEGVREVRRALDAGLRPATLFVRPDLAGEEAARVIGDATRVGARVFEVSAAAYAKLALREESGGIVAVLPVPAVSPDDLRLGPAPLVLAASGLEKPGNLGALLRSADAFGVDALAVEGGTDLWNPNVVRASLGCLFTVPVATLPRGGLLGWLRARRLRIVASTPDGDTRPDAADLRGAVAILVGSEEKGLEPALRAAADVRVRIPMRGSADSLNVSVSAGVLLYEAARQRRSP